jgi:glutamate-1-semialdehyde 2,1-aminomutase
VYLDFVGGWGPLILGHKHPQVQAAVQDAVQQTAVLGLTHPAEVALAREVAQAVPSVEQIRFMASGSEAGMTAVRLARAVTGREKIVVCEGCYHGHSDALMVGETQGIPAALAALTIRVPFNDLAAVKAVFAREDQAIAAVLVEPIAANMGIIPPDAGFLPGLRALTREAGALLILDEVVTGFRLHYGAVQDLLQVPADLTLFGKIIGGGFPIGALGGAGALMHHLAPQGKVYHGGTFAGHPLSMAAGLATLQVLQAEQPYEQLDRLTRRLTQGLADAAERHGVPVQIHRQGSLFTVFFSAQPIRGARDVARSDRECFAQWVRALLADGIVAPPSPAEAWFVSTAHTLAHVEQVIASSEAFFKGVRR